MFSCPVKLVLTQPGESAQVAEPATNGKVIPPGAKPSQKEIDTAITDPKVQQVQEILGGKVKSVERTNYETT